MLVRFIVYVLLFSYLLVSQTLGATDVYVSQGELTGNYSELTDAQDQNITGTENSFSIRDLETFSIFDLGLDVGVLRLTGRSLLHDISYSANYINAVSGLRFKLYPNWIEYNVDLGYRFGIADLEIIQTQSDGSKLKHSYSNYVNDYIVGYGLRLLVSGKYQIGFQIRKKNTLFEKISPTLNPRIDSGQSVSLFIGYRFGVSENEISHSQVPDGNTNYRNPCRLFGACN